MSMGSNDSEGRFRPKATLNIIPSKIKVNRQDPLLVYKQSSPSKEELPRDSLI